MSSNDREKSLSPEGSVDPPPQDRFWESFFGDAVVVNHYLGADELSEIDEFLDEEMLALLAYDEMFNFEIDEHDDHDTGLDMTDTSSSGGDPFND